MYHKFETHSAIIILRIDMLCVAKNKKDISKEQERQY